MARSIILDGAQAIACPKCSHEFPLTEGISRQTIERYAEDFERAFAERRKAMEEALAADARRRAEREIRDAKALAREQFETELRSLREAVSAKDGALDKSRTEELALRRQLRELEEAKKSIDLDYQRKLDDELTRREALFQAQIASAQREVAELKRKLEQGSQQLQGEALELSLESVLKSAFAHDEIVPVPKGMNGADLLQHVRLPSGHCCGTIVWEAKQTKAWQPLWIQKLKDDQHAIGAELAVIVTAAMPRDVKEPFTKESDIWIARFDAARPLAEALRAMLVELHKARQADLGRAENAERVYNYICSPQFAQRFKASYQAIAAMRADLDAERAAMARLWKKRESQLERMQDGLLAVVGDLQGMGQDGLPQLDAVAALPAQVSE